jgi:hypothetical protein
MTRVRERWRKNIARRIATQSATVIALASS